MSTNNREFDFFALMASLEAHMLKDPNVRDASPSEALENYFSRKGKRSQRRKNAFRAQRHRRDVMAEKFDTTSKNDGILRKTYKDGYAKFESSHGRVKKEDMIIRPFLITNRNSIQGGTHYGKHHRLCPALHFRLAFSCREAGCEVHPSVSGTRQGKAAGLPRYRRAGP